MNLWQTIQYLDIYPLRECKGQILPKGWGAKGDNMAKEGFTSQSLIPQYPSKTSRTNCEMVARSNQ